LHKWETLLCRIFATYDTCKKTLLPAGYASAREFCVFLFAALWKMGGDYVEHKKIRRPCNLQDRLMGY